MSLGSLELGRPNDMTSENQLAASLTKPTVTTTTQTILLTSFTVLAVSFVVILLLLAFVTPIPWWLSIILAVLLAGAAVFKLKKSAGLSLIKSVGAVEVNGTGPQARIANLLEGLSLTSGINEPTIYIVHDHALNAAALAHEDESYVLATTGLIENLSRIELEGVMAELVERIKSGDAEVATVGAAIYGPLVSGPLAGITKPLGSWLINRLYVPDRELICDGSAVILTRYPPGLLSGLEKIKSTSSAIPEALPAYDPAWFVSPRSEASDKDLIYNQTSDVSLRIDVLAEL